MIRDVKIRNYYPEYKDEGEVIAGFGEAKPIKYLDGKLELRGGSEQDRVTAWKWISTFMPRAVVWAVARDL